MTSLRRCSRSACGRSAVATLTYVYGDSTAVVGPLATIAEPHSYDLCEEHAVRLTVPRGWEVVRHVGEFPVPAPQVDDLEALADAVREAARVEVAYPVAEVFGASSGPARRPVRSHGSPRPPMPPMPSMPAVPSGPPAAGSAAGRRGHLRVVPAPAE